MQSEFINDGDDDLSLVGIVGNHQDAGPRAHLPQVVGVGRYLQFGRCARLDVLLVERHLKAAGEHLQLSDGKRRLTLIGDGDLIALARLVAELTQVDAALRQTQLGCVGFLSRREVVEVGQQDDVDGYLLVGCHLLAGEGTEINRRLRQTQLTQVARVELQCGDAGMARCNARRLHLAAQIGGQVHELRLHHLVGVVEQMNLHDWHVAAVHVVELHLIGVGAECADGVGVQALEVLHPLHDDAFEREHEGLFAGVAVYGQLLLEMAHLLGVVGGADRRMSVRC